MPVKLRRYVLGFIALTADLTQLVLPTAVKKGVVDT